MLSVAKRALAGQRILPYDAEVEYLESTGTQWIDTGVVGNIDTTLSIDWLKTQAIPYEPSQTLIGAADGAWDHTPVSMSMWHYGSVGFGNNSSRDWGIYRYDSNTRYTSSLNKNGFWVNGSFVRVPTNSLTSFSTNYTIAIFSFNQGRGLNEPGILKCYGASIKSGDLLVRDFIPVRVGSVGYMYDRVSGRLFGNMGTGSFTVGPDIWKNPYVTDGLVAMWDGEWNAGKGGLHDTSATAWTDLVSGMVIPFADSFVYNRTYYWRDKYIEMDGYRTQPVTSTSDAVKQALAGDCTIELIADVGLNQGSVSTMFAYDATSAGFLARNQYVSTGSQSSAVFSNNFMWRFARPLFKSYSCGGTDDFYRLHDVITIHGTVGTHYQLNVDGTIHTDTWTANAGNPDAALGDILSSNKIKCYGCRIYNRALTADEVARNYAIDKARFGLP